MKNKELALKISKHPLMKKVAKLEDKRVIARLVIEELLRESEESRFKEEDIKAMAEKEKNRQKELLELTYDSSTKNAIYNILNKKNRLMGNTGAGMGTNMVKGVDVEENVYLPSTTFNLSDGMYYISDEGLNNIIKSIKEKKPTIEVKAKKVEEVEPKSVPAKFELGKIEFTIKFQKVGEEPEKEKDKKETTKQERSIA